jgi:hypothetical protein
MARRRRYWSGLTAAGFNTFLQSEGKTHFCDGHHISKATNSLASPYRRRLIGSREIAMMTAFLARPDATPLVRRDHSPWRLFLDEVIEPRVRRAEPEIVEYLARHRHDLPPESRL